MSSSEIRGGIPTRSVGRTGLQLSELGFGTAALGNLYRVISDEQAEATLATALDVGIRYFDTAPFYGFGLSERRVGDALRGRPGALVSTKVGRLLIPTPGIVDDSERRGFHSSLPFEPHYDYTYTGVMRSFEDSLQRLGLARVDIVLVHDVGSFTHGAGHGETFGQLIRGGGLRALEELRASRVISAIGVGVNETAVCVELMNLAAIDVVLLAGRYTLLEDGPLEQFFPVCEQNGVKVVIGGPYNSGILASGTRGDGPLYYDYAPAKPEIVARVKALESVCDRHGVSLPAAALQFCLAHPAVVAIIPGHDTPARVRATLRAYRSEIPYDFWEELRAMTLLRPDAPTPSRKPT